MKAKSLLQILPVLMLSATMATTTIAAGKVDPEAVKKGMLTALNNQVSLSADQQDKAKPIIGKHIADLKAVKNDAALDKAAKRAKVVELRQQYVTILTAFRLRTNRKNGRHPERRTKPR